MGSAAWFGPHLPRVPRPFSPVLPCGFLKKQGKNFLFKQVINVWCNKNLDDKYISYQQHIEHQAFMDKIQFFYVLSVPIISKVNSGISFLCVKLIINKGPISYITHLSNKSNNTCIISFIVVQKNLDNVVKMLV